MSEIYDSREDTKDHIAMVKNYMDTICLELCARAVAHDASKLEEPEVSVFDRVTPRLNGLTYGSKEYVDSLAEMGEALTHHYANNRHHPEHHVSHVIGMKVPEGIHAMNLVDVIEMFCDWCAATLRHEDGDICESIDKNKDRFGYGNTLACLFANTAQDFSMGKGGHRAYAKQEWLP